MIRACTFTLTLSFLLALSGLPSAAGDEAEASLLVKCRAADVEAVLKALQGLDAEVYDLRTMERLAAPTLVETPPLTPLSDAALVMGEVWRVVAEVGGESTVVLLERASIRENAVRLRLRVSDTAIPERIRAGLTESEVLGDRLPKDPGSFSVTTKAEGSTWLAEIQLKLGNTPGEAVVADAVEGKTLRAIVERSTIQSGLRWVYASRERVDDHGDALTLSQRFDFDATTKEKLAKLLRSLTHEPDVTVLEVEWTLADPANDPKTIKRTRLEVGRQIPKPK